MSLGSNLTYCLQKAIDKLTCWQMFYLWMMTQNQLLCNFGHQSEKVSRKLMVCWSLSLRLKNNWSLNKQDHSLLLIAFHWEASIPGNIMAWIERLINDHYHCIPQYCYYPVLDWLFHRAVIKGRDLCIIAFSINHTRCNTLYTIPEIAMNVKPWLSDPQQSIDRTPLLGTIVQYSNKQCSTDPKPQPSLLSHKCQWHFSHERLCPWHLDWLPPRACV